MPAEYDTEEPDGPGLRRRKKEQTRRLLREGAARLFAARGFSGTTVADIAGCANVSERTFFRYFDSKEALLVPDGVELFAYVEGELAARPAEEDPLTAVCQALRAAARPFTASSLTALSHPVEGTDALVAARLVQAFADFEDRLAALVRRRMPPGTPDADLRANVIACAALAAVRAVLRTQRTRRAAAPSPATAPPPGPDAPAGLLTTAFEVLAGFGTAQGVGRRPDDSGGGGLAERELPSEAVLPAYREHFGSALDRAPAPGRRHDTTHENGTAAAEPGEEGTGR